VACPIVRNVTQTSVNGTEAAGWLDSWIEKKKLRRCKRGIYSRTLLETAIYEGVIIKIRMFLLNLYIVPGSVSRLGNAEVKFTVGKTIIDQ
jgi:hypothetical protein